MTQRERRRRRRSGKARNKILLGIGMFATMIAVGVLGVGIWVLSVAAKAPPIEDLKPVDRSTSSQVFAADGSRLGYIQSDVVRTPVSIERIPKELQQATVAIEDERFYEHSGIDINAIARAAIENIEAGKVVQGGSTITQQLVRNLYISDPERDLQRKIREATLAEELEDAHSKSWILEQYLNTASYGTIDGRTSVGAESASQTYFNKPVQELKLTESALLAGLPQSPSRFNPLINPTGALERRNQVLQKMAEQGYITDGVADRASQAGLGLERGYRYTTIREPYFFDYVQQDLISRYGVATVRQGGLNVYTTIQPHLQEAAKQAIIDHGYTSDPAAAVVSIDPANGNIVAMASSGTYQESNFNLAAQGHRQPGSSMKVYVLTTAIRQGVDPDATTYESRVLNLNLPEYGPWRVTTAEGSACGCSMSIREATQASDNTVFAQMDLDLGPENVRDTAYDMGIETTLDAVPAEGIGGLRIGVTPLEMANGSATLADGGIRNTPRAVTRVEFPNGDVDEPEAGERQRVFSDGVAYEVTDILKGVIEGGTGTAANIGCPAAGKTGTTDDFTDAWFVGYTPKLSTAVWVGHPNARSTLGGSAFGGTLAAPIWHDYMLTAKGDFCEDFPAPEDPVTYEPFYGKYASGGTSSTSYDSESPYDSGTYDSGTSTTPTAPSTGTDTGSGDTGAYAPGIQQGADPVE
ncbi:MAG TPA: transglycosylase domain-containing protein [Solirubrobacterales bacterium]|nr:transglycosylase domain-containing protein [Solirubrobacterales bacterium]